MTTADDATNFTEQENISTIMIGRGILQNPFLAGEINGTSVPDPKEKNQLLREFHAEVYSAYAERLNGFSHQHMRMIKFWSYFSENFPEPRKAMKKVKKATSDAKYDAAVGEAFRQFEW
ncbi:tRNA-dihydrouridine synthase [Prolixibacter bellariivorans]|uniref:tRNA-dihydrouridine synthase n=1 Tax=Prolixibacter bellariivorans TaxID=314319 RepID=UPI0021D1C6CC|nr:tRNA-dihydrouridine synthase [Prolixibacter bellariivorans]